MTNIPQNYDPLAEHSDKWAKLQQRKRRSQEDEGLKYGVAPKKIEQTQIPPLILEPVYVSQPTPSIPVQTQEPISVSNQSVQPDPIIGEPIQKHLEEIITRAQPENLVAPPQTQQPITQLEPQIQQPISEPKTILQPTPIITASEYLPAIETESPKTNNIVDEAVKVILGKPPQIPELIIPELIIEPKPTVEHTPTIFAQTQQPIELERVISRTQSKSSSRPKSSSFFNMISYKRKSKNKHGNYENYLGSKPELGERIAKWTCGLILAGLAGYFALNVYAPKNSQQPVNPNSEYIMPQISEPQKKNSSNKSSSNVNTISLKSTDTVIKLESILLENNNIELISLQFCDKYSQYIKNIHTEIRKYAIADDKITWHDSIVPIYPDPALTNNMAVKEVKEQCYMAQGFFLRQLEQIEKNNPSDDHLKFTQKNKEKSREIIDRLIIESIMPIREKYEKNTSSQTISENMKYQILSAAANKYLVSEQQLTHSLTIGLNFIKTQKDEK